jgi:hypothetical protein
MDRNVKVTQGEDHLEFTVDDRYENPSEHDIGFYGWFEDGFKIVDFTIAPIPGLYHQAFPHLPMSYYFNLSRDSESNFIDKYEDYAFNMFPTLEQRIQVYDMICFTPDEISLLVIDPKIQSISHDKLNIPLLVFFDDIEDLIKHCFFYSAGLYYAVVDSTSKYPSILSITNGLQGN